MKTSAKPHWNNHCNHPLSSFVGTFEAYSHGHFLHKYDLYMFENFNRVEPCIRYGNEPSEYYSPDRLEYMIRSDSNEVYKGALELLNQKGDITWNLLWKWKRKKENT